MRTIPYAGVAAIAALLIGSACGKKSYEGEPTPQEGAPAEVARADSAGQRDTTGQQQESIVGRDSAMAMPAAPAAPPSLALDAGADGQSIFRHDTFGNERFWTETMKLHEVIQSKLDPTTAMKHGLKVDAEAVPAGALEGADMNNPATTLTLLKANAIVGIKAVVDDNNQVTRVGITCALCHSTVDNSVQEGVGRRMDGWANRQLNVGALIAMSPAITDEQREVLNSWGPGKFDPYYTFGDAQGANPNPSNADMAPQTDPVNPTRGTVNQVPSTQQNPNADAAAPVNQDQKNADQKNADQKNVDQKKNEGKLAVVVPPAYGLANIENVTYTAEGSIAYWNSFVAVNVMHGKGQVVGRDGNAPEATQKPAEPMPAERGDTMPQRGDSAQVPRDTAQQQGNMPAPVAMPEQQHANQAQQQDDFVTSKLSALRDYQHSLEAPAAPEGSFDQASATRGERVFRRACISCHVGVTGTDNNSSQQPSEVTPGGDVRNVTVRGKVHAANETGMDPQYAERSESKGYRTTPLRGLWQHAPYFHDGSAATLADVVTHYNKTLKLKLTARQQKDLVEFLKSK